MPAITLIYEGEDLIIPREQIEALGVQPGNEFVLELRPKVVLTPRKFPPEELERRREIVRKITGIWSAEDEAAYRKFRRDMWATWKPRTW
jgi:hypothetical protein